MSVVWYYRYVEECQWECSEMIIRTKRYRMDKKTPKGAWIIQHEYGNAKRRFVLDGEGKRWAYPTEPQALASFIRRKEVHINRLKDHLVFATAALKGAKSPDFKPDVPFVDETLEPYHTY